MPVDYEGSAEVEGANPAALPRVKTAHLESVDIAQSGRPLFDRAVVEALQNYGDALAKQLEGKQVQTRMIEALVKRILHHHVKDHAPVLRAYTEAFCTKLGIKTPQQMATEQSHQR